MVVYTAIPNLTPFITVRNSLKKSPASPKRRAEISTNDNTIEIFLTAICRFADSSKNVYFLRVQLRRRHQIVRRSNGR